MIEEKGYCLGTKINKELIQLKSETFELINNNINSYGYSSGIYDVEGRHSTTKQNASNTCYLAEFDISDINDEKRTDKIWVYSESIIIKIEKKLN